MVANCVWACFAKRLAHFSVGQTVVTSRIEFSRLSDGRGRGVFVRLSVTVMLYDDTWLCLPRSGGRVSGRTECVTVVINNYFLSHPPVFAACWWCLG